MSRKERERDLSHSCQVADEAAVPGPRPGCRSTVWHARWQAAVFIKDFSVIVLI